ncbi:hypothetical protein [Chitinophaga filiformis]|uniref:Uncharacterized protein n=1 Tax=Chitinophaga filiformis TaxID=104663 RepID=A0A1G8CAB5_CHIFI|nr:hypothetical protein [Chitinophaga filiformis]SDH42338.1 hypothetical protein SAMN04488121_11270 [Chitinophaga filiformis]
MKVCYANNWLPAIASVIEERYIAIDEQDQIAGYNKSALKTLQVSETQIEAPDCRQSVLM